MEYLHLLCAGLGEGAEGGDFSDLPRIKLPEQML